MGRYERRDADTERMGGRRWLAERLTTWGLKLVLYKLAARYITRVLTYFVLRNFSCGKMLIGRYGNADRIIGNNGDGAAEDARTRAELDVI